MTEPILPHGMQDGGACVDPQVVGGKAARLGQLIQAGFDVPRFLVLTDPFFERVEEDIVPVLGRFWHGTFAVRSSGAGEDGSEHSHAGQFLSILDVPPHGVLDAARKVRASGQSDGLAGYRRHHGLEGAIAPAVIVQAMVPARIAGVAFCADPATGRRDIAVISCVEGLADRLVGGEVDGMTLWVNRGTGEALERSGSGDDMAVEDVRAILDLLHRAEASMGGPQDVEWAFEGPRLRVLQTRPITTPLRPAPIADEAAVVLDNSNIVESYPGLVSPLTYSFACHAYAQVYTAFVKLLGVSERTVASSRPVFENMLCRFDGRVYYRLDNWYRAIALLPGYRLNRTFMEGMMGVDEPLPADLARSLGPAPAFGSERALEWLKVARTAFGLGMAAVRLPGLKRDFGRRLDVAIQAAAEKKVDGLPLTELAALYRRIEANLLDRWDAPLVNDFLCMIAFGASKRMLVGWGGPAGEALHNAYMIGQGDLVSAEPAKWIRLMGAEAAKDPGIVRALAAGDVGPARAVPALSQMIDAYLDKFADRCAEELKLESPTLRDDPTPLYGAIVGAVARPPPERTGEHPDEAVRRLLARRHVRRLVATTVLRYARRRVRDRENLRFERTRIFGAARRVFMAMGAQFHALGVLDDPRDVLNLTVAEILGVIEGGGVDRDLARLARLRKEEALRNAELPDPPNRITGMGAAILAKGGKATHSEDTGDSRKGTGCSGGLATGIAKVVIDPRGQRLEAGEILVAHHTDPGWIGLFANAAAIVVERGSPLSHSAIVSRELGIPCVVGIRGITSWAASGDRLRVDGANGEVRKVDG